jgi:hypothetical protein
MASLIFWAAFLMRLVTAERARSINLLDRGRLVAVCENRLLLLLSLIACFSKDYLVDQLWLKKPVRNSAATSRASTA